jgi:Holliday junction DNA helicase RuvB
VQEDSETGVYPLKWGEYIGQDVLKKQIQLAARSARIRRAACEHILITGAAGTGKTALAKLAAREMRTHVVEVSGRISTGEVRRTWASLPPRTVIFWDEFHRAVEGGKKNAEWMLHFLQDGKLLGPFGPEPMPELSIFAATTDDYLLPDTILGRFWRHRMADYSPADAARIVLVMARKVLVPEDLPLPSKDNARDIAAAANRNPRAMLRMLKTLRDMAVVDRSVWLGQRYSLDDLFLFAGVTPDGLDTTAQEYLIALLREFPDGAGAATLRDRLGEHDLSGVERVLVEKGYIGKTRSGRTLTSAGIKRAETLMERHAA